MTLSPAAGCSITITRPSGQIDLVGRLGDAWRVTDVQLDVGDRHGGSQPALVLERFGARQQRPAAGNGIGDLRAVGASWCVRAPEFPTPGLSQSSGWGFRRVLPSRGATACGRHSGVFFRIPQFFPATRRRALRDTESTVTSIDTSAEARETYLRRLAEMTASERLDIGAALWAAGDSLQHAAARRMYPEAGDAEITFRIAVTRFGAELARKAYGRP